MIEAPSRTEVKRNRRNKFVALEPGTIVMPTGNPRTQELLEKKGVKITVDISEIKKGRGNASLQYSIP